MEILGILLMLTTLLCSLVAGFLFAFAVVIMPGIGRLDDRAFLRAFQAIDRVIQNGQPLFALVWLGSILALVVSAILGIWLLDGRAQLLLGIALLVYLLGVQWPTLKINIPLNNHIQSLNLAALENNACELERRAFESHWNRWNQLRTCLASVTSLMLLAL